MRRVSIFAPLVLLAGIGLAQRYRMQREDGPRPSFASSAEFHFIRVEYTDLPQYHRRFGYASRAGTGEGWWMVDWPDAEDHFTMGVQRLTRIDSGDPRHLRLTDDRLFDYPWIYATQTGWWGLTDAETARLHEGRIGLNFDLFGNLADLERDIDGRVAADLQDDARLHKQAKPRQASLQFVRA